MSFFKQQESNISSDPNALTKGGDSDPNSSGKGSMIQTFVTAEPLKGRDRRESDDPNDMHLNGNEDQ